MVRPLREDDVDALARLRDAFWPESIAAHADDLRAILAGAWGDYAVFVSEHDGVIAGFAEVSMRPWGPAYLEGWYVLEEHRRNGVGSALARATEDWARAHGCDEMQSDTWIDNEVSQRAHASLGFEEVERVIVFAKKL
jgi:aminoglycoside 6'-N-acetyltransferase I